MSLSGSKTYRGERPPVTFGNTGLGYELIDGKLHGEPNVYPYYNELSKVDFLDEVLSYRNQQGETPALLLRLKDIILKRKIVLSCLPEVGDILLFPNTAGYMLHFYETRSHLFDFTTNLVMDETSGTLAVHRDEL